MMFINNQDLSIGLVSILVDISGWHLDFSEDSKYWLLRILYGPWRVFNALLNLTAIRSQNFHICVPLPQVIKGTVSLSSCARNLFVRFWFEVFDGPDWLKLNVCEQYHLDGSLTQACTSLSSSPVSPFGKPGTPVLSTSGIFWNSEDRDEGWI